MTDTEPFVGQLRALAFPHTHAPLPWNPNPIAGWSHVRLEQWNGSEWVSIIYNMHDAGDGGPPRAGGEMSDIAAEMRKAIELRGDTYSSMEIWGLLGRGAAEIERLQAEVAVWQASYKAERRDHEATIAHADKVMNEGPYWKAPP
jgi:hypothetical protein